jgi:hypothetical protein
MTRIGPLPEVTVIRSGYASDARYEAAIASALAHGRQVRAIDAKGQVTRLPEPVEVPEW